MTHKNPTSHPSTLLGMKTISIEEHPDGGYIHKVEMPTQLMEKVRAGYELLVQKYGEKETCEKFGLLSPIKFN